MKHVWIMQHAHVLAHGHICTHTQKHTLTPALVCKCSHPHVSTQELHMHRSSTCTQTLVYMHLKHTYWPLRGIHLQPTSSSSMQTVTHTRRQPLTRCHALIHPKALTRTRGQSQTQNEPTAYTHAEVSTHSQTHSVTVCCSTPWAGVCTHTFSGSWTHVWTSCLCPCLIHASRLSDKHAHTEPGLYSQHPQQTCALTPYICILCTHTHACTRSAPPSCEPLSPTGAQPAGSLTAA